MKFITDRLAFAEPIISLFFGVILFRNIFPIKINNSVEFDISFIWIILLSFFISGIILIVIFTKLPKFAARIVYTTVFSLMYATFVIDFIYSLIYSYNHSIIAIIVVVLITMFMIFFFVIYFTGNPYIIARNMGIIIISIITSFYIQSMLDIISLLIFIGLLAFYDIYSVFRGPLSRIIGKPSKNHHKINPNQSIILREIKKTCKKGMPVLILSDYSLLGMGDTLIFSILMFIAISIKLWLIGLILISILLGAWLTHLILKKYSPLPALPIPVFLSLIILIIFII